MKMLLDSSIWLECVCERPDWMNLWLELVLRGAEGFNTSTVITNKDVLSSHEVFYEGQPTYHRVPRQGKTDPRM